ncbi:Ig-like domain-containing protein [Gemmobacter serpentinus]|uniref:Ig-like domain-containing protein n=1 Tax=Gemmobacter serpentinus TaxID=2652247 RepID=UPI0018657BBA|nr:Ig-like domain-containing protein [Gemmobacter serpentinus]
MVQAIDFAVRNSAGAVVHGTAGGGGANFIQIGSGEQVSLNLSQSSVLGYERRGGDLVVKLVDGNDVTLSGFYNTQPGHLNRLYISSGGEVTEVMLQNAGVDGPIVASYGPVDAWNKFSTVDDLRFESPDAYANAQIYSDEPAGMGAFAPGLLGAGGLGAAAIAAGLLGGAALLGGGGGKGDGDGTPGDDDDDNTPGDDDDDNTPGDDDDDNTPGDDDDDNTPGDDDDDNTPGDDDDDNTPGDDDDDNTPGDDDDDNTPGDDDDDNTPGDDDDDNTPGDDDDDNTPGDDDDDNTPGDDDDDDDDNGNDHAVPTVDNPNADYTLTTNTKDPKLTVTGTGEPGDKVVVVVGDKTQTTVINDKGTWGVVFEGKNFPKDGDYSADVTVTGGGKTWNLDGPDFLIDMTPPPVAATQGVQSVGDVENAAEYKDGVTIGGTSEAGATVKVEINGYSHSVKADAKGEWKVTFTTSELQDGERIYDAKITATDPLGNKTVINEKVVIDTLVNVAFDDTQMGDNVISGAEKAASAGITLTGTGEAGATITVTFEGKERTATVASNGTWSVNYGSGDFKAGTYDSTVTVSIKDAAGNTTSDSHVIKVDTQATGTITSYSTTDNVDDRILNNVEAQDGLTITGTVEAGSTVQVSFDGKTFHAATVTGTTWTVDIPANEIPSGEKLANVVVKLEDRYGNTETLNDTLQVDRVVRDFTVGKFAGDNVLNAEERDAGVTLSGKVEAGATVYVTLSSGATAQTVANSSGNWSVKFNTAQLPEMANGTIEASVYAKDVAGNFSSTTLIPIKVDTEAPDVANFVRFEKDVDGGMTSVRLDTSGDYSANSEDQYAFTRVNTDGSITKLTTDSANLGGDTLFEFTNGKVPDGSYLVVTAEDRAGNESSSLIVVDNKGAASAINLSNVGLSDFDFSQIDLREAAGAKLTLSAADLNKITGLGDELLIKGGADDYVTLTGFGSATVKTEGGYHIYTLGDTVLRIEDDINVNTI